MNIRRNEVGASLVSGIQLGHNNIYDPRTDETATERLVGDVGSWRDERENGAIVFTSGVYDLMHPSHQAYLLHVKAAGAEKVYDESHSDSWGDLSSNQREEYVRYVLSSTALKLILSIDGDKSVSVRKAGKGGSQQRPIMGWNTRAITAAGLTYRNPENYQERLPLVDAVTIHGPQDFDEESIHRDLYGLAEALEPDFWGVYEESDDILQAAPHHPELARVAIRTIGVGYGHTDGYWHDEKIGKISTTAIVRRVMGASN